MEQRNNLVLQGTETFSRGQLDNVALDGGALVLDSVAGRCLQYGSYTTPEFAMPAFCNLNVSWNAHAPQNTMVEVRCRVYAGGSWTGWMSFGKWAPDYPRASISTHSDDGLIFLMGDTVTVAAINVQGTVIAGPDKNGSYQVQLGNMKMKCAPEELRLPEDAPKPPKKKQTPTGGTRTSRPGNTEREARTELDIRGMASDEGLMEVDRFLDRCMMMGIKNATIIHGKGTGVLRAAVQQHLRRLSFVKSQRPGMYGEGEMGVTVVELK